MPKLSIIVPVYNTGKYLCECLDSLLNQSIKDIEIIAISVLGIILYPLFDFILCKFFTNSTFEYSIFDHIIQPIILGVIVGLFSWSFDRKKK